MKKVEIIPAINVKTFRELKEKIRLIEPYAKWIHLDVADKSFTPNTSWHNPKDLTRIKTSFKIESHLMISPIDKKIKNWLIRPVKRIIFHLESSKNPDFVINQIKKAKKEAGISINPKTSVLVLKPYLKKVKFFHILAVSPGKAGQKFQKKVLKKVSWLRKNCKNCSIEGDGGMKVGIVRQMTKAGVNKIASASAIFGKSNVKKAILELKKDALI